MKHLVYCKSFFYYTVSLGSLLFAACLFSITSWQASHANEAGDPRGLVIVMNSNIELSSIDDEELRRLFTGKSRRLPNGARAALASCGPESSFFNERMLGLSDADVAALWSRRLRFSGRTPPPRTFNTVEAIVEYVASTPNALAYARQCCASGCQSNQ